MEELIYKYFNEWMLFASVLLYMRSGESSTLFHSTGKYIQLSIRNSGTVSALCFLNDIYVAISCYFYCSNRIVT